MTDMPSSGQPRDASAAAGDASSVDATSNDVVSGDMVSGDAVAAWKRPRGRRRYTEPVVVDAPPASAPAGETERRLAIARDERAAVLPPAQLPPVTHTPATRSPATRTPAAPTPATSAPAARPATGAGAGEPTRASSRRLVVGGRFDGPLPEGDRAEGRLGSHAAPGLVDGPARPSATPPRVLRERQRVGSHAAPPEARAELAELEAEQAARAAAGAAPVPVGLEPAALVPAGLEPAALEPAALEPAVVAGVTADAGPALASRARRAAPPVAVAGRTLVMGILNVTPDSFSDGGRFTEVDRALAHARELLAVGADVIDVGGESTRPGSVRVDPVEERRRVLPVVRQLASEGVRVSVDTMNAATAAAAVEAGAEIVNDVSGGLADRQMARVVAETGATFVAMHWRGHLGPGRLGAAHVGTGHLGLERLLDVGRGAGPDDEAPGDMAGLVRDELEARVADLVAQGVDPARIVLDPGVGFSKDAAQNWQVLAGLPELTRLGFPVLVGASRKRFLGELLPDGAPAEQRDPATAVVSVLAAQAGAWAVRVHDVAATRTALDVWRAWERGRASGRPARHA